MSRQTRHALTALAAATPSRRRTIADAAEAYLSQVNRRAMPVGYGIPIADDRANRADAYHMRGGDTLTRMLGIGCRPTDATLPGTARAVLAELDAPVQRLTVAATASGQPDLVAVLWLATAVRAV
ncbi:hypothetical protein OG292_19235 [Streptomyces sp. NBC_01511]|uniref:hypothetical protein n=1 Tax=unclassified Streptomyces TaxID=2593676 RepID=UPI003865DBF6